MTDRYPGYDVLAKRGTPSWDAVTRQVIEARLAVEDRPSFLDAGPWATLKALCERILPQPAHPGRPPAPLAAYVDRKLARDARDGYRRAELPPLREAWTRGLAALEAEALVAYAQPFDRLDPDSQDALIGRMQAGELRDPAWGDMPCAVFFSERVQPDIVRAYYAHPDAWNEIGFGGPASPRGYVRLDFGKRDPWEASQARPGREERAARENAVSVAEEGPRAKGGRAPDVFARGGWVPMRTHADGEEVDFAIVGTGAGGATLAARLAESGFSVVAFDAGPFFRPLEDFASDEEAQSQLYWLDERITDGADPLKLGGNNSGKAVGGSTVHFAMVSLRFRPEHFRSRTLLGYGADWPVDWREMWAYYDRVERALAISGPLAYPWGPPRPAYPYRPHPLNAGAQAMAVGCERIGVKWAPTPLATVSAPRGKSPPCAQRGFCRFGCSTNAKQSALTVWIPRALAAGAEVRDLAMVGRIELDRAGRATGLHYHREGAWRFQKARHVVVAGYAIETPRLLLNSACPQAPDGVANSSGLVGKNLMTQGNQGVWGWMEREVRSYKAPPSLLVTEHWNYDDTPGFPGGYSLMSQGPLPQEWAGVQMGARGLWGEPLRHAMQDYNHQVGLRMVGEGLPSEANRVTLTDERDGYGLPIPRITYGWTPQDKALIAHAMAQMERILDAAGATRIFRQADDTNHLAGTARMGDDPRSSVVDPYGRSWDHANLWVCDGSLFPTSGGVNPSLTIQALALRTADHIARLAARGEL